MLMIRMQRIGRRNDPAFRILVLPKTSGPKAGTYVELLGTYNPKTKAFTIKEDRVKYWMSQGAQLSDSLNNLFINKKIIDGTKVNVLPKKNPIPKEGGEEVAAPAAVSSSAEATQDKPAAEAAPEAPAEVAAPETVVEVTAEEAAPAVAEADEAPAVEEAVAEAAPAEEAPKEEAAA